MSTPFRREHALFAHGRGVSLERACSLVRVARSSVRYQSRMIVKDAPVIAAMRELSALYPRFGYRRIRIYLEREGHSMGMERAHRLWRQAGLQVPRSARVGKSPRRDRGRMHRPGRIRYGLTISCSIIARMTMTCPLPPYQ
jgi:putative transposase